MFVKCQFIMVLVYNSFPLMQFIMTCLKVELIKVPPVFVRAVVVISPAVLYMYTILKQRRDL